MNTILGAKAKNLASRLISSVDKWTDVPVLHFAETAPELFNAVLNNDIDLVMECIYKDKIPAETLLDKLWMYSNVDNRLYIKAIITLANSNKTFRSTDATVNRLISEREWAELYIHHADALLSIISTTDNITIRKSTQHDAQAIKKLITERYGAWAIGTEDNSFGNIDDRFYLMLDNDKIIALSGIINKSLFNGCKLDWTCISKEYEHRGLITRLLKTMLDEYTGDKNVYCSCWKTQGADKIHLHYSMQSLGFVPVQQPFQTFMVKHSCNPEVYQSCKYCTGNNCRCSLDLYVLDIAKYRLNTKCNTSSNY